MQDITGQVAAGLVGVAGGPSNTPLTVTWQGLHWFSGTLTGHTPDDVLSVLAEFLNASPLKCLYGGFGYQLSARVGGAAVYWSHGRDELYVVLEGAVCESLGVAGVVAVATLLDLVPTSRLDLAWDIEGLAVSTVAEAFIAGDVVTRIHRDINPKNGKMRGIKEMSNYDGNTVYLGARKSHRFLRVYDKRGPTRLEMEWKHDRALALWGRLLACPEEQWSNVALTELRAFIDFRVRSASVHPRLCPLLDWWAEVVTGAGRDALTIPRKPATLERVEKYMDHQVAPSLALWLDTRQDPVSALAALVRQGQRRYLVKVEKVALRDAARFGWEVLNNAAD